MSKKRDQEYARLGRDLVRGIIISAFEKGDISYGDIKNPTNLRDHLKKFSTSTKKDDDLYIVIDHRETILKDAKKHLVNGKYDYAKVFFAMYFEHETNHLLINLLQRRNMKEKTVKSIVQKSLNEKLTWILDLIGEKRPNEEFLKFLQPLSEDRNSFMHYKFAGKQANHDYSLTEKEKELLLKNVAYFRGFVSRSLYGSRKTEIISLIYKQFN